MVPMQDLAARHRRVAKAVEDGVLGVLRSGRYVGGPVVDAAESQVATRLGRRHGIGAGSGTRALAKALRALDVGPGDEVVVPAVTFFATAGAVLHAGATPVVVDVLPDRPLMDPDAARAAIGPRTRAVVPVHLFGSAAPRLDVPVPVVDDSAQSVGASPPAGQGVIEAVSFYPTKVLGAAGDGGLVATDDDALAQTLRALGFHGMTEPNVHGRVGRHVGGNDRLDAVQAAVLLGHLDDLDARIARRREIAARYDRVLGELAVPRDPGSPVSVYVLRHPERDRLRQALSDRGVASAVYYPLSLSAQPALGGDRHRSLRTTPNATAFCDQALALPCAAVLDDADVDHVIACLEHCL